MRSILLSAVVSMVIAVSVARPADAAALAFDSAADPAYAPYLNTGTLPEGINGGYGWGPWEEWYEHPGSVTVSPVDLDAFSTNASWLQSPLTSPGAVWAIPFIFDRSVTTFVVRHLDELLAVGQTLSFDFEYVPVIGILSPNGTGATYEIDPGNPYRIYFEANPADAGPGFVNNLSITPEPGAAALIAAAGLGLLLRRNRKGRSLDTPAPPCRDSFRLAASRLGAVKLAQQGPAYGRAPIS